MTLLALAAALLLMGCAEPTPLELLENARIAAQMKEASAQRRAEMAATDRSSADERRKSWLDTQQKKDAALARGISPVDR